MLYFSLYFRNTMDYVVYSGSKKVILFIFIEVVFNGEVR